MRQKLATKQQQVAKVRESFERSVSAVLIDFRGVPVTLITELRARFKAAGVEYRVLKNNLVRRAVSDTAFANNPLLLKNLKGPTGVAWSFEDPSAAAKVIKAFRKESDEKDKLTVKCGLLESSVLGADQVEAQLAALPGKDEMRSHLLAQLLAPAQAMVRQLAAPGQNLAYVVSARERKLAE